MRLSLHCGSCGLLRRGGGGGLLFFEQGGVDGHVLGNEALFDQDEVEPGLGGGGCSCAHVYVLSLLNVLVCLYVLSVFSVLICA